MSDKHTDEENLKHLDKRSIKSGTCLVQPEASDAKEAKTENGYE